MDWYSGSWNMQKQISFVKKIKVTKYTCTDWHIFTSSSPPLDVGMVVYIQVCVCVTWPLSYLLRQWFPIWYCKALVNIFTPVIFMNRLLMMQHWKQKKKLDFEHKHMTARERSLKKVCTTVLLLTVPFYFTNARS